jgi:hypothetical protein
MIAPSCSSFLTSYIDERGMNIKYGSQYGMSEYALFLVVNFVNGCFCVVVAVV